MMDMEYGLGESVKLQGRAVKWVKAQKKKIERVEKIRLELIADLNEIRTKNFDCRKNNKLICK